ncbi:MAG TPA: PPK2 family polyphosphate kinase [Pyrinomonadaceae bacterium]|jgi:PPK2 family polyphosphate:nucleotide phosphotransferase
MRYSEFIAPPKKPFSLAKTDPDFTGEFASEKDAQESIARDTADLAKHHGMLMAHEKYGLLVIFQGMDAAGKDPIIRSILASVDPQGVESKMFKKPTEKELRHDYLWRSMRSIPARGQLGIFNRSYYEQVTTERVHPEYLDEWTLPDELKGRDLWERRFREIQNFEEYLVNNGIHVLKFFLHQSKEKQRERLLERIERTDKRWGFSATDVEDRQNWDEYMRVYGETFERTSTENAPWYVVPDQHRWFAKAVVAAVIVDKLKSFHQQYPRLDAEKKKELERARRRLEKTEK